MKDWDRHEINNRKKIHDILEIYQLHGALVGIPAELQEGLLIYRTEALYAITEEIYQLMKTEIDAHARRPN